MLVQVGRRETSQDVVDLLTECHGRIRRFLAMARALADAPASATHADIAATASQIRRYFAESFALHVEDEEVDIAPRIVESVAARVHGEHEMHEPAIADLIAVCTELARHPEHLATIGTALRATVAQISSPLEAHLAFEEDVLFSAIRALDQTERDAIRDAMRARRERQLGGERAKPA
jgi:iron-sulfur cluster repair protein YtfE (RIC family)